MEHINAQRQGMETLVNVVDMLGKIGSIQVGVQKSNSILNASKGDPTVRGTL